MPFELLAAGAAPKHGACPPGEGSQADNPMIEVHAPFQYRSGQAFGAP